MKRLNILYISLYLPIRNLHGGGNRMFEQVKYLSSKHDVYLLSFLRDYEEPGLQYLKPICKEVNIVKLREKNSKSYSFAKPGFVKNYYSKEMTTLIYKKIREINFNVVQFEYLPMTQYSDGLDIKTILTEHQLGFLYLKKEMELEKNYFKKLVFLFRYNRLMRYERKILCKFDHVVFISNNEAEYMKDINPFVSPMGVDAEYFKSKKRKTEDTDLIYVGNFDNYQNKDTIFYFFKFIWPLIKKKRPKINLKIIGYKSKERLDFLEKKSHIEVIGYVDDIRSYIESARLYILPARINGGMKGKLLEALAMEKPVISTSIGIEGYRGDILKAIRIADTPEGFVNGMLELLYNENLRRDMGYIGRRAVEKEYTWECIFSKIDSLYEENIYK